MSQGLLTIFPTQAHLTHDTETFSFEKMDPYCKIKIGDNLYQTSQIENGGKSPCFSDQFSIEITSETIFEIELWDKDTFSKDDLIGQGTYDLTEVYNEKQKTVSVALYYKNKPAGIISVDFYFSESK